MKTVFALLFTVLTSAVFAQNDASKTTVSDTAKKLQVVEAACGECQFGLKGKSCDLAIRIDGQAFFVDGTHIDSHGDAHAKDGFCNSIRKAEVKGELVNGRFKATYFKLIKNSEKKEENTNKSKQGPE